MLGRESFKKYDNKIYREYSPFYFKTFGKKFHKYNTFYGKFDVSDKGVTYEEYSFDIVNNSERGMFVSFLKFVDMYYKKVNVDEANFLRKNKDYVYYVVFVGVDEKGMKKVVREKSFTKDFFDCEKDWKEWDELGYLTVYETFMEEEDLNYLLKGIFEGKFYKRKVEINSDASKGIVYWENFRESPSEKNDKFSPLMEVVKIKNEDGKFVFARDEGVVWVGFRKFKGDGGKIAYFDKECFPLE